jgi:hypothetical protein
MREIQMNMEDQKRDMILYGSIIVLFEMKKRSELNRYLFNFLCMLALIFPLWFASPSDMAMPFVGFFLIPSMVYMSSKMQKEINEWDESISNMIHERRVFHFELEARKKSMNSTGYAIDCHESSYGV